MYKFTLHVKHNPLFQNRGTGEVTIYAKTFYAAEAKVFQFLHADEYQQTKVSVVTVEEVFDGTR